MNHQPKKGKAPQLHLVARAILACLIVLETYTILTTTLQSSSGVDPTTSAPVTTAATAVVQASVTERDTFEQLSRRTGANDAVVPRRARSSNTIIRTKRKTHKLGERPAKIQQLNTVDVVESNNLIVGLSRRHVEPTSNVTAAICFKTLFGNIDLGIVIQWAGMYSNDVKTCFCRQQQRIA